MSVKTDSDKEAQPDLDLTRDRKERKSKRRQKRRNSEPMGKLIRGQKQVKGMKRPELTRLGNGRRSSGDIRPETCNTSDESDNESMESPHTQSTSRLHDNTPEHRISLSAASDSTRTPDSSGPNKQPIANNLSQRLSRNSLELDGSVSSTHSDEERDRAAEQSNLTKKRESNRDSGIGSMTLSEHASADVDKDANGSGRRGGGPDRIKALEDSAKKADPVRKQLCLEGSEEDDAIEELIENMESPDELEALEALPETVANASVGHEDAVDLESLPSYIKKSSPSEPFKLRHTNIKSYRPLNAYKNGDVWLPMSSGSYVRNRSASYGARPLSADIAMHVPLKIPLCRSNSDDRYMLAAVNEMQSRSHSDPNMLDTNTEDRSSSPTNAGLLDASPSPLGASGETSSFFSNENLLESVNNAFKKLGEKFSQFHLSDNEDAKSELSKDDTDNKASAVTAGTELAGEKPISEPDQPSKPDKQMEDESRVVPPPKTVVKLAREFSRKAKEGPKFVVTRHVFSDPYLDRDGTSHVEGFSIKEDEDGHAVVRPKTSGKVTSKIETFQKAMTENESWQVPTRSRVRHISDSVFHATPVRTTGSSSDEDKAKPQNVDSTPSSLSRKGRNRRSVRDAVRKFEKPSPLKKESKVVTPTVMGIQQRLQAIRQNAEFQKQSQQDVTSSKMKSLQARRQELHEWVSRPITRKYNRSEGNTEMSYSDTASHCSDEPDGMSSYASSVQSSAGASPVHITRGIFDRAGSETSTDPSPLSDKSEDSEPLLFRSLKERFQELEKAVSKPVPKTCANPKEEIEAEKQGSAVEKKSMSQSCVKELKEELKVEIKEETEAETKAGETEDVETSKEVEMEDVETEGVKTEEVGMEEVETEEVGMEEVETEEVGMEEVETEEETIKVESKEDTQQLPPRKVRSNSSPVFLRALSSEGLHRATSCESNYTDARSEFSTQDSSEESFHSGYATPTESFS